MKKSNFLSELAKKGKIKISEPSQQVSNSYLKKSENSLKSAKILLKSELYENSISMSYYAMYNCLIGLFFRIGIKSENHSGSILLFKKLFRKKLELFKIMSFAKEERIDRQYYVTPGTTKKSADDMVKKAEKIVIQLRLILKNMNDEEISKLREIFSKTIH